MHIDLFILYIYLQYICSCTTFFSNLFCLVLFLQIDSHSSKSVPIVITVIVVMLLSIAAGVVFVKKYVCGGRLVCLSTHTFSLALFTFTVLHCVILCFSEDFDHSILTVPYRFLVHRYSVLQQHVEDTAAEGMDEPLETNHAQNGKIEFHDDSDEVQWILFPPSYAG